MIDRGHDVNGAVSDGPAEADEQRGPEQRANYVADNERPERHAAGATAEVEKCVRERLVVRHGKCPEPAAADYPFGLGQGGGGAPLEDGRVGVALNGCL